MKVHPNRSHGNLQLIFIFSSKIEIVRIFIFSEFPLRFFSLVVTISNALFSKTMQPSAVRQRASAAPIIQQRGNVNNVR